MKFNAAIAQQNRFLFSNHLDLWKNRTVKSFFFLIITWVIFRTLLPLFPFRLWPQKALFLSVSLMQQCQKADWWRPEEFLTRLTNLQADFSRLLLYMPKKFPTLCWISRQNFGRCETLWKQILWDTGMEIKSFLFVDKKTFRATH